MLYESAFQKPRQAKALLKKLEALSLATGPIRLMEICGTHTMAIAQTGIKSLLPKNIELLSGPGCPVCVTPANVIDEVLRLSSDPHRIIASYGDLLRVPGSHRQDTLWHRKAMGAHILSVYSPMDALEAAKAHPEKEVLFLGVGFETTAPGTAACILEAARQGIRNFFVLSLLKQTPPALHALIEAPDFKVSGFLCPGHVAAVTGSRAFKFLPEDYALPAVISGFEAGDLLASVFKLTQMIADRQPALYNEYIRLVKDEGNPAAQAMIRQVFEPGDSVWRGLGSVAKSGLRIRSAYADFDGARRFGFAPKETEAIPGCRCAEIIRGVLSPWQCPLFKTTCTPKDPVGPCMVSSEGACAAAYKYSE